MIKSEVLNFTTKSKSQISFFEDDFIDNVRHQISKGIEIHPDRLFILVGLKLPHDYYLKDPRRWESLFDRLSLNGEPILKETFKEYLDNYRRPSPQIEFYSYDRIEWLSKPDSLKEIFSPTTDFIEYRILGVDELKSYILPLEFDKVSSRIPAARLPIPQITNLFSTYYAEYQIENFIILPYEDKADSYQQQYFPLLRTTTPPNLSVETINLLDKNTNLLKNLIKLKSPDPDSVSVIKTRYYVPWVDTEFGEAVRTRFEQIFYGLTVSSETPYIGLFTSKDQINRHKFYVEDPKLKKPFLDMSDWNTWWNLTKPSRNKPTLIFYRGSSKHNFDRIAITSVDLVLSTHRSEDNEETLEELQKSMNEWLLSLDALIPFLNKDDISLGRWELQDMTYLAKYEKKIDDFDLLRFNCISSLFDIGDKSKSQFSLLRTDHSNDGLSAIEVKVLQALKDGRVDPDNLAQELSISVKQANELIHATQLKVEENPRLSQKSFRGYPTMKIGPEFIIVSSVNELKRSLKYANILRYVLTSGEDEDLDAICPKRMEKVVAESGIVPVDLEVDAALAEDFSDLFADVEQEESVEDTESISESIVTTKKISTEGKQGTLYNYFKTRLQQFDPETFHTSALKYPKKCEQKHQPVILSEKDLKRLEKTEYDPRKYSHEDKLVDTENPDGTIVCPDYWCMRDQIPLQESQILIEGGVFKCPVCKGKLQTSSSNDPREFPLVKRETGFVFPGFVEYKSPKSGKNMPCCFRKSRAKKNAKPEKGMEDKYYILGEDKSELGVERISYIPKSIIESLHINEKYEEDSRRFVGGMTGFFRVGLGHSSQTLPKFLKLKTKIPAPRESVQLVTKCSFMRTWKKLGSEHLETISASLKKLPEYTDDKIVNNVARIISGIDEAFHKKELTPLEEIEYSAIALQCDIFRIDLNTKSLGCVFYVPILRPRTRGIIILQDEDEINILAHTTRESRGFSFHSNVFEAPFKKETFVELEKLRNESCKTEIPSYSEGLAVMETVMRELDLEDDYSIILDPFGRGQAFYIPSTVILPFRSSILPDIAQSKISGYADIDKLPSYENTLRILGIAEKVSKGYSYKEDLYNSNNEKVEILTQSGLRIPIIPLESDSQQESTEVIQTIQDLTETELSFGDSSKELINNRQDISYTSEVYEFLLYQLTKDIQLDEFIELKNSLDKVRPKQEELEQQLSKWFEDTTNFVEINKPIEFLSKIRTPCGQFKSESKCSSNLCGWDSNSGQCRIEIKDTLNKPKLFRRLLLTLMDNSKIRSMVLDGRTSPFFSTVLYLELPNELIVTDNELPD